jgi:parvulin-like peptidyl-prolyl isomerase
VRDLNTLKKFYKNSSSNSQPTDEQVSDQAIARLISNVLVEDLAKKYKASVSQDDVDQMKNQIAAQFESKDKMLADLKDKYGWTFDQYTEVVIKPLLLEQKVAAVFASSTDDAGVKYEVPQVRASHILFSVTDEKEGAKVKVKAESVLKRIKAGEDFAKLAKEFGSDGTKENGGDLGWFGKGQMVQEFEDAAFALTPDQLSDKLVKTQFGYHIVKATGKRMVRDFSLFMQDQIKDASMKFLVPIHNPFEALQK